MASSHLEPLMPFGSISPNEHKSQSHHVSPLPAASLLALRRLGAKAGLRRRSENDNALEVPSAATARRFHGPAGQYARAFFPGTQAIYAPTQLRTENLDMTHNAALVHRTVALIEQGINMEIDRRGMGRVLQLTRRSPPP